MLTRNKVEYSQGFYEDPLSSTIPSPINCQTRAVRTFGNHVVMHFNLDEPSVEQGPD